MLGWMFLVAVAVAPADQLPRPADPVPAVRTELPMIVVAPAVSGQDREHPATLFGTLHSDKAGPGQAQRRSPLFGVVPSDPTDPAQGDRQTSPVNMDPLRGPGRKVVCGLTVIPTDNRVDSKFVVPVPNTGVQFTMRRVPKPMCGNGK